MPVPAQQATLTAAVDSLQHLPEGAGYQARSGRATVSLTRRGNTVEATARCDSIERVVELMEELYLTAGATADSLRQALSVQQQSTTERRSNGVQTLLISFTAGLAAGIILTLIIKKKYGST
jgi:deoxyhypusine synthase